MSFSILGIGTALPQTAVGQADAVKIAKTVCCRTEEQGEWLPNLYRQSGIANRHLAFEQDVVTDLLVGTRTSGSVFLPRDGEDDHGPTTRERMKHYKERASPLALKAARSALSESGVAASEITHLVTVSCTGFYAPGVDIELIRELSLSPAVERTHLGFMGCHGAMNGLRVGRAYTAANSKARVLLAAVELCVLHYHYAWDPKQMVANALFADGAAAVVGVAASRAPERAWRVIGTGGRVFANSEYAMTWDIGDHGFVMSLSTRVPELIAKNLRPWLESWLGDQGFRLSEILSWAVHPGGPRIISAVEEALDLPGEATAISREVLSDCGNMSSPTILFIIERMRRHDMPRPCLALGFGPGLAVEATLFA
jgi:predicted naringenin-chalcone synthase